MFHRLSPAAAIAILLTGATMVAAAETAIKPEVNPPGDIPDNQLFILHNAPEGFSLKVPEGWARQINQGETIFTDKYNIISAKVLPDPGASTSQIKRDLVPQISASPRAPEVSRVTTMKVRGRDVVIASYTINSEPNSVTGKQIRLEAERVYYPAGDKVLQLTLSAPDGADNVDQWNLIVNSVRFK
jgi:hypothetical protein